MWQNSWPKLITKNSVIDGGRVPHPQQVTSKYLFWIQKFLIGNFHPSPLFGVSPKIHQNLGRQAFLTIIICSVSKLASKKLPKTFRIIVYIVFCWQMLALLNGCPPKDKKKLSEDKLLFICICLFVRLYYFLWANVVCVVWLPT